MKILIIDNQTHFLKDLISALHEHEVKILDFQTVTLNDAKGFDCVILSGGGSAGEVADNKLLYKNEIKIVRESNIPIFGICEGFQVIGAAYNSDFRVLQSYRKGTNSVQILVNDPIFGNLENFTLRAFEYHHIAIGKLGKELIPLAISEDGIEVMKHKRKLIYATQFHPEELQDGNDGHTILHNFLTMV
jgi:anthranilate/para-aminobenzoate synthase component II